MDILDISDSGDEDVMMQEEDIQENNVQPILADFKWPEDKAHPLFIPWIVQQIFDYLPLRQVERQQGVCKLWAEEATKIIRKKKIMVFYEEEVIKHYNTVMRHTFTLPHTAFEFHACNLSSNTKHLTEFWQLFGSNIKRLEFHQSTIDGQALHNILAREAPNLECLFLRNPPKFFPFQENNNRTFPNLKEIIFQFFPYSDLETGVCLKYLLKAVPNLERIHFVPTATQERVQNRMMNIMLDVLTDAECNIILPRLAEIDIRLELESAHVTRLLTKRFPLSKLEVVLTTNVKSKDFREYLNTLSGSLNKLSVTFPLSYPDCQNCFLSPIGKATKNGYDRFLFNLTHLSLNSFAGSLNFVGKLQNLASLQLYGVNLTESVPNGFHGPHKLHTFNADTCADCKTICKLAACFPTLKVLQVTGVNDDSLRTVYRELPFITELVLKNGCFTDTGISGVSPEVCIDMAETTTYVDANPEKLRLDLYIGSLPNLSVLKLESPAITDLSVILGLISCPKLASLSLQSNEITDTGMRTIGNKMNKTLVFLDASQCSGVSEAGKFYVKEKLKGRHLILELPRPACLSFQYKPNRFIVTMKGRREVPRCRPGFLVPDRRHLLDDHPHGLLPGRNPIRAARNREDMFNMEEEVLHIHRDRILALHEHVQEQAANLLDDEPILEGNLEPAIQRQLLEAAHDAAALELNAGMLPLLPIAVRDQGRIPPVGINEPRLQLDGFLPLPMMGMDQRGLEAQFIERRRRIFMDMVRGRERGRRHFDHLEGPELPLMEDDLFWPGA